MTEGTASGTSPLSGILFSSTTPTQPHWVTLDMTDQKDTLKDTQLDQWWLTEDIAERAPGEPASSSGQGTQHYSMVSQDECVDFYVQEHNAFLDNKESMDPQEECTMAFMCGQCTTTFAKGATDCRVCGAVRPSLDAAFGMFSGAASSESGNWETHVQVDQPMEQEDSGPSLATQRVWFPWWPVEKDSQDGESYYIQTRMEITEIYVPTPG